MSTTNTAKLLSPAELVKLANDAKRRDFSKKPLTRAEKKEMSKQEPSNAQINFLLKRKVSPEELGKMTKLDASNRIDEILAADKVRNEGEPTSEMISTLIDKFGVPEEQVDLMTYADARKTIYEFVKQIKSRNGDTDNGSVEDVEL